MSEHRPWLYDFYHLWAAGTLADAKGNPYNVASIETIIVQLPGWSSDELVFGFLQLPQTLWLYAFFGLFPFHIAKALWALLHALLSAKCLVVLRHFDDGGRGYPHPLFILGLFPFTWSNLFWGQYNTICLFGLLVSAKLWKKEAYTLSGLTITLTLFKPHLCIPCLAYMSTIALLNRRYGWMIGVVGALALQTLAVGLINPEIFVFFLEGAIARSAAAMNLLGAAPVQVLAQVSGITVLGQLASLLSLLMGVSFALKDRQFSQERFLLILVPFGVILAPYAWAHTFLLLLPIALPLSRSLANKIGPPSLVVIALIYSSLFIASIIPPTDPFLAILPLTLGFYLLAHRLTLDFSGGRG